MQESSTLEQLPQKHKSWNNNRKTDKPNLAFFIANYQVLCLPIHNAFSVIFFSWSLVIFNFETWYILPAQKAELLKIVWILKIEQAFQRYNFQLWSLKLWFGQASHSWNTTLIFIIEIHNILIIS